MKEAVFSGCVFAIKTRKGYNGSIAKYDGGDPRNTVPLRADDWVKDNTKTSEPPEVEVNGTLQAKQFDGPPIPTTMECSGVVQFMGKKFYIFIKIKFHFYFIFIFLLFFKF